MTQANKYPDYIEQDHFRPLNLSKVLQDLCPEGLPDVAPLRPRASLVVDVISPESEGGLRYRLQEIPGSSLNPHTNVGKLVGDATE